MRTVGRMKGPPKQAGWTCAGPCGDTEMHRRNMPTPMLLGTATLLPSWW